MTTSADIERAFASVPLLSGLAHRQRARLAARATTHSYPPGSTIVREGDTTMALYVVLSGSVGIERTGYGGRRLQLGELAAGSVFGEMGLIDDAVRSATVLALERTSCALVSKWDFEKPLRTNPAVAVALLRTLNARVRRLEERITAQTVSEQAG